MQYRRFLLTLLLPIACMATSVIRLTLEEAVNHAEWIVEGDVVRNWSDWDSSHRFIWTHTEIKVRDRWKGEAGSTITVSEPGGIVGTTAMSVPGMVRYAPGEHVVALLYRVPNGMIRTVGLSQGKLQVDSRGIVHANADGTSIGELESRSLSDVKTRIAGVRK